MSYSEDDEKQLLIAFAEWLYQQGILGAPSYAIRKATVDKFLSERKAEREWGKR